MSNPYPIDSIWIGRDYEKQANFLRGVSLGLGQLFARPDNIVDIAPQSAAG